MSQFTADSAELRADAGREPAVRRVRVGEIVLTTGMAWAPGPRRSSCALIAVAEADEMAIVNPGDEATLGFAVLALPPALFLLAELLFLT